MRKGIWVVIAAILLGPGCRSAQLAKDQDTMRKAILDLNTNQIMDNLIRLDKGLPIVHVDYTQLTGQITQSVGGEGDFQQNLQNTTSGIPTSMAGVALIVRQLTNMWTGKLTSSQMNQLSVTGQPVTNAPEVYNAYLDFYAKSGRLVKSTEPPAAGEAIIVRRADADCDDTGCSEPGRCFWRSSHTKNVVYYWVPCAYKRDFRELCLYAVALRGQAVAAPDYYEVTILGVEDDHPDPNQTTMTIVLDKEVPNARGYLVATIGGRLYEKGELVIQPFVAPGKPAAQPLQPGRPEKLVTSDRLQLTFALGKVGNQVNSTNDDAIKDLAKQGVRLKFDRFGPPVPKTSDLLGQIRNQLDLIRLGQQLQRVP